MRRLIIFLAILIALPSARSGAADLPIAERPVYKDGDVFEYVERFHSVACKRWEMKGRAADGARISRCDDNIAYFSAETGALLRIAKTDGTELVKIEPQAQSIPFPLQIGTKWSGDFRISTAEDVVSPIVNETCEVVSFETVKVAAGDLPAFRFDCATNWSVWFLHGTLTVTSWYAPSAKAVVKVVNGSDPKWNMELARYSIN